MALAGLAACNSSGCLDNGSAIPLAGFYSSASGRAVSVGGISIHGVGAPNDSALLTSGSSASEIYLPMRASESSTSWVFSYYDTESAEPIAYDTITLAYDAIPYFASEDCGAMYCYRINSLTNTTRMIDSVALVDPLITNADVESIKIYFRTSE
jgi:hypothetical protein